MNDLVTADTGDRGAEDLSVSASTTIFMKPCVSAFSTARPTRVMGHTPTNAFRPDSPGPGRPSFRPAQRRIDIEGVRGYPIADTPRIVVREIAGDDLEVVVRRVGECASAVAVAHRPDVRHRGSQLIVDDDVSPIVDVDTGDLKPKSSVFGCRPTAISRWVPGTGSALNEASPQSLGRVCANRMSAASVITAMPSASRIPRIASETSSSSRDVKRGPRSMTVTREPSGGTSERIQADVAAADDDQMFGSSSRSRDSDVGGVFDARQTGEVRYHGPAADIQEDPVGLDGVVTDTPGCGTFEPRVAPDQGAATHSRQPCLDPVTIAGHDFVLARLHL